MNKNYLVWSLTEDESAEDAVRVTATDAMAAAVELVNRRESKWGDVLTDQRQERLAVLDEQGRIWQVGVSSQLTRTYAAVEIPESV
jgi:hypothetical protein